MNFFESGLVKAVKPASAFPFLSTIILWKFHLGTPPIKPNSFFGPGTPGTPEVAPGPQINQSTNYLNSLIDDANEYSDKKSRKSKSK